MREIKFKAWDSEKEKFTTFMIVNNGINFGDGGLWVRDDEQKRFKLLQYTGYKDKNYKEIYEGDICFCNSSYFSGEETGIVEWDKDYGWVVKFKDSLENFYNLEDITVIGTSYR